MLIKSADDKTKRLALLDDLKKSPLLKRDQIEWLDKELERTKRGLQGERDAAHYLDNYLKDDPDRALLHDLRLKVDGDVVQIDHLVLTRGLHVYLLETKCFSGDVEINDHGEWTVRYGQGRGYGIESPLEQSRRHEGPLMKLFERLEIAGRTGAKPKVHHCVLLHPKATIKRPDTKRFDTSDVIKADQFRSWHEKFTERNLGIGEALSTLVNMRGSDATRGFAEKLARQHRPDDPLRLPEFMKPRELPVVPAAPLSRIQVDVARRSSPVPVPAQAEPTDLKRKLICVTCKAKITFPEGKFCWNNERRFGGFQYCREHQAGFSQH